MTDQVFKPYHQNQLRLLPLDLEEMIDTNHMVRIVDEVIDALDPSILYGLYKGGGTSAYNPVMMLKVIIYAYSSGIYSSRKIEAATKENIHFMWLSGLTPLDHMTINRFRSERIKDVFEQVFTSIVEVLAKQGRLSLETYFLDGTKIEANAGKYTYVWAKSNDRYHENLKAKIRTHLEMIDRLNEEEDALLGDKNPEKIDSEEIRDIADKINEKLRKQQKERAEKEQLENKKTKPTEIERELRRTKKTIEKEWLPKMERYEKNEETLGGRNSFSKTDTDATFMRMKDDHLGNGQLKAAYNIQTSCEGQFITGYSIHQNPGDTSCMIPHLKKQKELMGRLPGTLVADAAYGSEENYAFLEENEVRAFVKYNWFFKEQKTKTKNDPFYVGNWPYHETTDSYICPQGCMLEFVRESTSKTPTGYEYLERTYRCQS
jgi:transposase